MHIRLLPPMPLDHTRQAPRGTAWFRIGRVSDLDRRTFTIYLVDMYDYLDSTDSQEAIL